MKISDIFTLSDVKVLIYLNQSPSLKLEILLCPVNANAPASVPSKANIEFGITDIFLFLNFILLFEIDNLWLSPIHKELLLIKTSLNLFSTLPRSKLSLKDGIILWLVKIVSLENIKALLVPSIVSILLVVKLEVEILFPFFTFHPLVAS